MKTLTPRQNQVLEFITDTYSQIGVPPTIREIMRHFGWTSTNAVMTHLRPLERKGYVTMRPNSSRGITLLFKDNKCPCCGHEIGRD